MSIIAEYKFDKALNTLPLVDGGYSYTYSDVDNGDNTITRTISTDTVPTSINFEYCDGLLEVYSLNISGMTSLNGMFAECYNLVSINTADWDTSRITSMNNLFVGCESLVSLDVSNWITNQVRDMSYLFTRCLSLTEIRGIENLNTANVTNMSAMFRSCSLSNLNLSNWNTGNTTNMFQMFNSCNNLATLDLSNWNVSKVTDMNHIFSYSSIVNLNLTGWNFNSSVITIYSSYMFNSCTGLNRIIMDNSNINSINKIIKELPTVTNLGILEISDENDISQINVATANSKNWNVTKNIIAEYKFNSGIDTLPTFNSEFTYTYIDADNSDGTITRTIFSDSSPTSISFSNKTGLVSVSYLDTSKVTSMDYMFSGCTSLTSIDVSNWDTTKVTTMQGMFYNCNKLTTLDLNNWNVSNVNSIRSMFENCQELTDLIISNWDTSNVTNMHGVFNNCKKLKNVDVSNWDVSKVTTLNYLFNGCYKIKNLDLSNWDISNVTTMNNMFYYCTSLTSLDLSSFDTSKVTSMNNMLSYCSNLTSVNMYNSDADSINDIIEFLPTRTADSLGTLKTGAIPASNCDVATANSKYWNVFIVDVLTIKNLYLGYQKINNLGRGIKNVYFGSRKLT